MKKAYKDKQFIGSVLVAEHGNIIYQRSFGAPNTDSTKFLLASVSKPITAILILRLADQKKLSLQDPLKKFFTIAAPEIGNITIHQLLTHTSGIKEVISKDKMLDLTSLTKDDLKSEPGSEFEYSNSGYVILKDIAEAVTAKKFDQLIQAEIFVPAGMTSSGVVGNTPISGLAKGYKDAGSSKAVVPDYSLTHVDGAGSIYSTTTDLYKLDRALYSNVLLSEEMKLQMLKQHVAEKFSYGWYVRERNGIWDVYWHKGGFAGFASLISRRVKKDQFVVFLSNAENADVTDLENEIYRILKKP